jgi:alkanesulfonate monooxygenase SsuD/methylene tetrahydromethanopterin reductase-like flavin-dependent oxidoreductase (luciferase family)
VQFSMIFEAQLLDPTPENERQLMHDCLEQAVLAEEMGFDRVWAVEHHSLRQYAHMTAPEIFLSHVSARTSRIRIGHGVVCLPFRYNHPIRVAERAAMLDILSNGRVDLGAGKGSTDQELLAFGIKDKDRAQAELEESLRIIPRMWREEMFEHKSDLIEIPPRPILPKPVQDPHPPLFIAATREPIFRWAGKHGIGALALGFNGPDEFAEKNRIYREAISEREPGDVIGERPNDHLSALCPAVVLEDLERAQQIGYRGQRFFFESIGQWRGAPPPKVEDYTGDNAAVLREQHARIEASFGSERITSMTIDEIRASGIHKYNVQQAYGTPETAIAYIERLIDAGADECMFLLQMGTIEQEDVLESIRNIGKHVIPHFRRGDERTAAAGRVAHAGG